MGDVNGKFIDTFSHVRKSIVKKNEIRDIDINYLSDTVEELKKSMEEMDKRLFHWKKSLILLWIC